jgi:predicted HNH restriction endonuclease
MTPDAIREFLAKEYPFLVAKPRTNPDGWSFFYREARRGADASRILRATRSNTKTTTKVKLAVSSRLDAERVLDFGGGEQELRDLVDEELRLYTLKQDSATNLRGTTESQREAEGTTFSLPEEVLECPPILEGAVAHVLINAYERSHEARRRCIAHHGTSCSVCKFNFGKFYGDVAEGYIHVHHLHLLSEISAEYVVDPVADLRPVCPNCHAIIHRRTPPYSIEEAKAFLRPKAGI